MSKTLSNLTTFQRIVAALVVLTAAVVLVNASQTRPITVVSETSETEEVTPDQPDAIEEVQAVEPEQDDTDVVLGATDRQAVVYVDANSDGSRSSGEDNCNTCVAKVVVLANKTGKYPALGALDTTGVQSQGTLSESELIGYNTVWAYYPDRKIFIKPQLVSTGDGSGDIAIAASEVAISVSAENAGVLGVESTGPGAVRILFEQLIPSMQNAAGEGKQVWVQVIPDTAQPDLYYVAAGVLKSDSQSTGSPNGYVLEVDFETTESLSSIESGQLQFFLL